jgi:hypothetical protein
MKPSLIPKRRTYYVPHPRYGSQPRMTGLNVENLKDGAYIRCWTPQELESWTRQKSFYGIDPAHIGCLIPGTAIVADPARQVGSSIASTHYYDIERKCRDCGQLFIFYALEQRYWYEELQFPVDANCIRCVPCRKRSRTLDQLKARYDELSVAESRTVMDEVEMTLARLDLVEAGIFHPRQIERVRAFLNSHPDHEQATAIRARLAAFITKA